MSGQLDLKLVLEAYVVKDATRVCQQLSEYGVRTLKQFATLTKKKFCEWDMNDYFLDVDSALCRAQELLTCSQQDLASNKQLLLVRA